MYLCVLLITLNSFFFYTQISLATVEPAQIIPLDGRIESAAERAEQIKAEISLHTVKYNELYGEHFTGSARVVDRHVTYSSRIASRGSDVLYLNPEVVIADEPVLDLDLRTTSAVTAFELDQVMTGSNLEGLGAAFVQAEIDHGVNAVFLASLAIHESAWGTSRIARSKNNLFGFGAFDRSPYESAVSFESMAHGIDHVAAHLVQNYLTEDGRFFGGGYTLRHVNRRYASDRSWGAKIAQTMARIDREILGQQNTEYHLEQMEAFYE